MLLFRKCRLGQSGLGRGPPVGQRCQRPGATVCGSVAWRCREERELEALYPCSEARTGKSSEIPVFPPVLFREPMSYSEHLGSSHGTGQMRAGLGQVGKAGLSVDRATLTGQGWTQWSELVPAVRLASPVRAGLSGQGWSQWSGWPPWFGPDEW